MCVDPCAVVSCDGVQDSRQEKRLKLCVEVKVPQGLTARSNDGTQSLGSRFWRALWPNCKMHLNLFKFDLLLSLIRRFFAEKSSFWATVATEAVESSS